MRDPAEVWPLLSPVIEGVKVLKEHVQVPSFDGKRMDNWVFRPETAEKVPVIINFSPYWSNLAPSAESEGDGFSTYLIGYYLPRGYAIVLSSVRGTGHSEGCFDLGGDIEKRDAAAVIEHFAAATWSNGNIAAGGKSYDGTTPQGVATLAPPALKAILPVSGISELYKYNYKGGLPYGGLHGASFNARYVAQVGWDAVPPNVPPDPMETSVEDACADFALISAHGVASAATGDYGPYWQERDYSATADKATPALFFVHGLQDWNVKPDHILPWLSNYGGPVHAWLHQWEIVSPGGGRDGHVYPFRDDWNYTMLRFLDHTLKGIDTGLFEEPSVQVQDSTGRWRHEAEWPPANVVWVDHFLSTQDGEGRLVTGPDAAAGTTRSFVDDGMGPTPATPSENQILYLTDPLAEDYHIAGAPLVHLAATTDRPFGKVAVNLYDVDENGTMTLVNWGGLNLRHRNDVRDPQPVVPGDSYTFDVELFPQDTIVPAGHRLLLALAGNAGRGSYGGFEMLPWQSTITVAESGASALRLPLEPLADERPEDPQPTEQTFCWAC